MKRFLKLFAKSLATIGQTALPAVVGMAFPPLSGVVSSIFENVLRTEAELGPKKGDEKKKAVLSAGRMTIPFIIAMVENQTNKDLDDQEIMEAYDTLVEGVVRFLNALGALPKEK